MNPSEFSDLLERYRNGLATPEEVSKVEEWYDKMDRLPEKIPSRELSSKKTEMLSEILGEKKTPVFLPGKVPKLARAIAAAASIAGIIFFFLPQSETKMIADTSEKVTKAAAHTSESLLFENSTPSNKLFLLPDSSSVLLYPGSVLACDKGFGKLNRHTKVSGKVFFEITHNAEKPFTVWCNEIVTKVLGTSFWISSAPDSKSVDIAVQTGRVTVYKDPAYEQKGEMPEPSNQVTLLPNQSASFSKRTLSKKINLRPMLEEQVVFQESENAYHYTKEPVENVLKAIANQYGLALKLLPLAKKCTFTGDINDLSLLEKLEIVSFSTNTAFKLTDSALVIEQIGCD